MDHPVARPARGHGLGFHAVRVPARAPFHRAERLARGHAVARAGDRGPGLFRGGEQPERRLLACRLSPRRSWRNAALRTALAAVRALERRPSGTYFVELKEAADGVPAITEINAGRFPSGVTALLALGKDNMVALFAAAAMGLPRIAAEPLGSAREYYLVRDIDAEPGICSEDELQGGVIGLQLPSAERLRNV